MTDRGPGRWADLAWALGIGGLALGLRLAFAWPFAHHPYGRFPWVDENAYWLWAQAIRGGKLLPDRPFYQDPLFAYVLAGLMTVVGTSFLALRLALTALGSLTPVAVFWAGRIGLGRTAGILAGLIVAVYRPLVFNDSLLEKEGLGALVAAIALGLTARAAVPGRDGRGAGVAGFAWGVLALLRANALLIGPLGTGWCLASFGARTRRGVLSALRFAAGSALALAPVVAINAMVADPPELLLTTWQAGANFYIGNHPDALGNYTRLPFVIDNPQYEADNFLAEAQRRTGRRLSPGQVSQYWLAQGLSYWASDPLAALRLTGWKLALVCSDFEIFDNQSEELVRVVAAPALGWSFLSFGWIAPLAALGLARESQGRTPFWWFVVLSTACGLVSTALFFVVGRYRVPWIPGLALLAAAGLEDTARRVLAGRWRALAWRIAVVAVPAAALAWYPTAETLTPGRWALFYMKMFTAYELADRLDEALDAIDDGRAYDDRTARAFEMSLNGFVARTQRDRIAAKLAGRIAAERSRSGSDTASRLRLVRWLRVLPDEAACAESRRLIDEYLAHHPGDPRFHRELGAWRLQQWREPGARAAALRELDLAARGTSGDEPAAILSALLAGDPRRLDQAARHSDPALAPRLRMARAALPARRATARSTPEPARTLIPVAP